MKLVEVNFRTPVFQNIGTLANLDSSLVNLEKDTDSLSASLENYRKELQANSPDLKIIDILSEEQIMNGAFSEKLVEALEKCKNTNLTAAALRSLGFRTEEFNFHELNTHITDAYTVLRNVVKECFTLADAEIQNVGDGPEIYLDMFRQGIKIASEKFLTADKYFKLKNIEVPLNDMGEVDTDILVTHNDGFNEWYENEVETILLTLFGNKMSAAYVAPIGLDEVLASIKNISPEAADLATSYGEEEFTNESLKKPEFIEAIKKLDVEKRKEIIVAIQNFNQKNIAGTLNTAQGPAPIPAAVTIIDAFVGFMLYVGETLNAFCYKLPNAEVGEIMDEIEDESIKTFLDLITEKLYKYENAREIACNMASIPFALVPMYIFTNPSLKLTSTPALNHLTTNMTELMKLTGEGDGSDE